MGLADGATDVTFARNKSETKMAAADITAARADAHRRWLEYKADKRRQRRAMAANTRRNQGGSGAGPYSGRPCNAGVAKRPSAVSATRCSKFTSQQEKENQEAWVQEALAALLLA